MCVFHGRCLILAFSFALLANGCMKDCSIGYHAEIIKHISTAIALSAFKNIFHVTVYSYNLKMKTIFSYCLLNLGGRPFTWKKWTQLFSCTMKFLSLKMLNFSLLLLKTKIPGVCSKKGCVPHPLQSHIFFLYSSFKYIIICTVKLALQEG